MVQYSMVLQKALLPLLGEGLWASLPLLPPLYPFPSRVFVQKNRLPAI